MKYWQIWVLRRRGAECHSMPLSDPLLRVTVVGDLWLCVLVVTGVAGQVHAQWHGEASEQYLQLRGSE